MITELAMARGYYYARSSVLGRHRPFTWREVNLGKHRKWVVRRAARIFTSDRDLKCDGILCVFRAFQNDEPERKDG